MQGRLLQVAYVQTPAAAFGHILVKRLNKHPKMFSFKVTKP